MCEAGQLAACSRWRHALGCRRVGILIADLDWEGSLCSAHLQSFDLLRSFNIHFIPTNALGLLAGGLLVNLKQRF